LGIRAACLTAMAIVALGSTAAPAKTVSINVVTSDAGDHPFQFEPASVDANPGDTVTWTNMTNARHTISPDKDGAFVEKDPFPPNATYSITVPDGLGPLPYHCNFHPMMGTINIVAPDKPDKPAKP
jgi:plastocyanin